MTYPVLTARLTTSLLAAILLTSTLGAQAQKTYAPGPLLATAQMRAISVELAQTELSSAEQALSRLKSDPLVIPADLSTANERLTQARAGVLAAKLAVRATLVAELSALASAENDLSGAKLRAQLAQMTLSGVQVKAKAGAANRLEQEKAETDLRNAQSELRQAAAVVADAQAKVRLRAGALPSAPRLRARSAALSTFQAALARHPRQLKADAAEVAAQRDLNVKSSDLSAAQDVSNARVALSNAWKTAEDTRRSLQLDLNDAWQKYQAAQVTLQNRQRSALAASEQARTQSARWQKGLISKQAALQAQSEAASAQTALSTASAALDAALTSLAVSANVDIWEKQ